MPRKKGSYSVYVGDVALDEYYSAARWPGIADKEDVKVLTAEPGGMIANAACVSAALGRDTLFLTVLNRGEISRRLLRDLEDRGIDTSLSLFDDSLPDSKTMIFLVNGEHTVLIPELDTGPVELDGARMEILRNAGYIYSTSGFLSVLRHGEKDWQQIAGECRAAGARIAVDYDVVYQRDGDETKFRNVDIGFFNKTGFDYVRSGRSFEETASHLLGLGMSMVVVTLAENGCVIFTPQREYRVPARTVTVTDVTGAGDTFCSSFISQLDDLGIEKAAEFATAAASICVSRMGARSGAVSREEVLKVLNS